MIVATVLPLHSTKVANLSQFSHELLYVSIESRLYLPLISERLSISSRLALLLSDSR